MNFRNEFKKNDLVIFKDKMYGGEVNHVNIPVKSFCRVMEESPNALPLNSLCAIEISTGCDVARVYARKCDLIKIY